MKTNQCKSNDRERENQMNNLLWEKKLLMDRFVDVFINIGIFALFIIISLVFPVIFS